MKLNSSHPPAVGAPANFDLVRLTRAKPEVNICANTLRAYAQNGLRLYRCGRAVFFSKNELAEFIRQNAK
jgi:hypothetical protein